MAHPELLRDGYAAEDENATTVAFVASQMDLSEGAEDSICFSSAAMGFLWRWKRSAEQMPKRGESQLDKPSIDYLSALTSLGFV